MIQIHSNEQPTNKPVSISEIGKFAIVNSDAAMLLSSTRDEQTSANVGDLFLVIGKIDNLTEKEHPARDMKYNRWRYGSGPWYKVMGASAENKSMGWIKKQHLFVVTDNKRYENRTFCITGALSQPRDFFITLIKATGGEYRTSVSGNVTHLLVASGANQNTTKMQTAKKNGTQIITETEFMRILRHP